ncbi:MAG: tetratricopeptide repeat protein, partial [Phycisphaerae bacterium]
PMTHLGRILVRLHRYEEALPLLREALETRRKRLPAGHWKTAKTESVLGACLAGLGRFEEAEPLLLSSYPRIAKDRGPFHRRTREALQRIVQMYTLWGKPEAGVKYQALLDEAEAHRAAKTRKKGGDV